MNQPNQTNNSIPPDMLAARLYAPGDLRVERCAIRSLNPNEVLLRVGACGVCGSDLPRIATQGTYHYPTIPGHEFMGEVVAVGKETSASLVGQRAAVIPLIGCGKCKFCRSGLPFHCSNYNFLGSRCDGGFAEYVIAPSSNLVMVDQTVSDIAAAMMEPAAVGLHAVKRPGVVPGDTVVVFGAGAIGLFAAQWACLAGAGQVIQVDIRDQSLEISRKCGVHRTINSLEEDALSSIEQMTDGQGADVAIEAAGSEASTCACFRCTRRRGKISLIGRIDGSWTMPEDVLTGLMRHEQTVYGNWGFASQAFPANDWEVAANALEKRTLVTEALVTHVFPLSQITEAIELMTEKKEFFCKVLITMPDCSNERISK